MRHPAQLLDFCLQDFASAALALKVLFDTRERKRETIRLRLHGNLSQEWRVEVGEHTAGGDSDASEELVELLVVAHGEPHVELDDVRLLVVTDGVAGELEDLDHPRCCMRRREGKGGAPRTLKVRGDPALFSIFLISWKRQSSI